MPCYSNLELELIIGSLRPVKLYIISHLDLKSNDVVLITFAPFPKECSWYLFGDTKRRRMFIDFGSVRPQLPHQFTYLSGFIGFHLISVLFDLYLSIASEQRRKYASEPFGEEHGLGWFDMHSARTTSTAGLDTLFWLLSANISLLFCLKLIMG